jgi:murein DD-endopeptidase / murein LD-carboxypeptidase
VTVDYAERARALVGTPFRPQGRGIGGLDCVGLALSTYGFAADNVRRDYRLCGDHEKELRNHLSRRFRSVDADRVLPGDLMLLRVANDQLHLAVRTSHGFVHADAQLRRVVETPGEPSWPIAGIYRKRSR